MFLPMLAATSGIEVTDPTAVIIAGCALGVNILIAIAAWLFVDREKGKAERVDGLKVELEKVKTDSAAKLKDHDVKLEWLQVRQGENRVDINSLLDFKNGALTEKTFDRATADQNRRLEDLKESNKELVEKVSELEKGVVEGFAKRPTHSQTRIQAVRPPERPPPRRADGVGDREIPSDPPDPDPVPTGRKKLPSIGRY